MKAKEQRGTQQAAAYNGCILEHGKNHFAFACKVYGWLLSIER
jgi:hypothetical protein